MDITWTWFTFEEDFFRSEKRGIKLLVFPSIFNLSLGGNNQGIQSLIIRSCPKV